MNKQIKDAYDDFCRVLYDMDIPKREYAEALDEIVSDLSCSLDAVNSELKNEE